MLFLSDDLGGIYFEHHRSGENRRPANFLKSAENPPSLAFIAHGYVHSWNGMYRRPAEMWTPNFNTPERDSMFWVFEGLTEYFADVLAIRAGMLSHEEALENFTALAATMAADDIGSDWRNLQDVNNEPLIAFRRPLSWASWQRNMFDSYSQGEMIWLEVDTIIRQRSGGKKSLDDFASIFFGGDNGSYGTKTYTLSTWSPP
jgi:predicted metalloprotease with PDZ domain